MEQNNSQPLVAVPDEVIVSLPTFTTLWKQAFYFTRQRLDLVSWYIGITIAGLLLFVLPVVLGLYIGSFEQPALMVLGVLIVLAGWAAALWVMVIAAAGLMYAVAAPTTTTFKAGWRWARPRFWAIAWLGLIVTLTLISGLSLLIIPGIIITVYTSFYFLSFIRSDTRGLHALAASTHIVYGRFWSVVGRLLLFGAVVIAINLAVLLAFAGLGYLLSAAGSPAFIVGGLAVIGETVGWIVSLFVTIMMMRYLADLHTALTATTAPYQAVPLSRSYQIYRVLAWLAAVAMLAGSIALGVLFTQIGGLPGLMEMASEQSMYEEEYSPEFGNE